MKRAILLLVVLVGGAFYLGWFTFTTDGTGAKEHVNIVIDKDKVHQDEARAVEKLQTLEQQIEARNASAPAELPTADRSADRRMQFAPGSRAAQPVAPQPIAPYEPENLGGTVEPAPAGFDPYAIPEQPRRPARPAAESDSFSRGFQ
jgi:hypothetical protein